MAQVFRNVLRDASVPRYLCRLGVADQLAESVAGQLADHTLERLGSGDAVQPGHPRSQTPWRFATSCETARVAVTQQLARLDSGTLEECRTSVDALDAVCGYQLLGSDDYLDLDWAPALLVATAEAAGLDDALRRGLQLAMSGEGEVNPAYRDRADSVWEHPVSSLAPHRVREVAHVLDTLARTKFLSEQAVFAPSCGGTEAAGSITHHP